MLLGKSSAHGRAEVLKPRPYLPELFAPQVTATRHVLAMIATRHLLAMVAT